MAKGGKATSEGFEGKGSEGGFVNTPMEFRGKEGLKGGKSHGRFGQPKSSAHHSMHHKGHHKGR